MVKHDVVDEIRIDYYPGKLNRTIRWCFVFSKDSPEKLTGMSVNNDGFLFWFRNRANINPLTCPVFDSLSEKELQQFNRNFKLAGNYEDPLKGLKKTKKEKLSRQMAEIEELKAQAEANKLNTESSPPDSLDDCPI